MMRLHIRHWAWIRDGLLNPTSAGTDLCYSTVCGGEAWVTGISQWAWDILLASNAWRALKLAGDQLHAAVLRVLEKGVVE